VRCRFGAFAAPSGVRLPTVQVSVSGFGDAYLTWSSDLRMLDVSAGSEERRLLELLAAQPALELVVPAQRLVRSLDLGDHRVGLHALHDALRAAPLSPARFSQAVRELRAMTRGTVLAGGPPAPASGPPPSLPSLPKPGARTLHGIELPPGSCRPADPLDEGLLPFWTSDEPVDDPYVLAGRLADVFPATGLWPLLWPFWDEVATYLGASPDIGRIDQLGLRSELARLWALASRPPAAVEPFGEVFPGLAPGMPRHPDAPPFAPFALAAELVPLPGARLLLVPCTRPADAAGLLAVAREHPVTALVETRLLRSYEERFGACPVALTPFGIHLAVERPPTGKSQSLKLAAELFVYAPGEDDGRPGALRETAAGLRGEEPACWFLAR
jgi:hypothetical protein